MGCRGCRGGGRCHGCHARVGRWIGAARVPPRAARPPRRHSVLTPARSCRRQTLLPLLGRARRAIMLSGTPMPSRHAEIYTTGATLRPSIFGTQKEFELRYCGAHKGRFGWDAKACHRCHNPSHPVDIAATTPSLLTSPRRALGAFPLACHTTSPLPSLAMPLRPTPSPCHLVRRHTSPSSHRRARATRTSSVLSSRTR